MRGIVSLERALRVKKFSFSLNQAIVAVVLVAALPGFLVALIGSYHYQQRKLADGSVRLQELSASAAASQLRLAESTLGLLKAVQSVPSLQQVELASLCQQYVKNLVDSTPSVRLIGSVTDSGELACAAASEGLVAPRNIRHLKSFSLAVREDAPEKTFTEWGPLSSEPVLYVLAPMPERGQPSRTSVAVLALEGNAFSTALRRLELAQGTRVEVVNSQGRVVAAFGGTLLAGMGDPASGRETHLVSDVGNVFRWHDRSGDAWLQHVREAHLAGLGAVTVRVSIREKELTSKSRFNLLSQLAALTAFSLVSMLFALVLGRRYLAEPGRKLLQSMATLESSDAPALPPLVAPVEVVELSEGLEALRLRLMTDRGRIQTLLRELQESQNRLLRAQELTQVGTFELSLSSRKFTATTAVFFILGLRIPVGHVIGRTQVSERIHAEDRSRVARWHRDMLRKGTPSTIEFRVIRPDGAIRWVTVVAQLVRSSEGCAAFYSGAIQDVTDLKITQFDAARREEALRIAGRLARLYSWTYYVRPGVMDWNDDLDLLMGYAPGKAQRSFETLLSAVHPEDRDRLMLQVQEACAASTSLDSEVRVLRLDDSVRHVHLRVELVRDEYRQEASFNGVVQDVTERVLSEARLRSQVSRLQLLRNIAKAMSQRMGLKDIAGVACESVHRQLPATWCAYAVYDEALNEVEFQLMAGPQVEASLSPGTRLPVDGNGLSRCVRGELVHEKNLSEVPFPFPQRLFNAGLSSVVLVPLRSEADRVSAVLVVADSRRSSFESVDCEFLSQLGEQVSLAMRQAGLYDSLQGAYRQLQATQDSLLQQERLSALGQMASGVAHDINNALSPAAIYLEDVLDSEASLSERARRQLGVVQRSVEDVASTIARIRPFYSKDEKEQDLDGTYDANEVVREVLERTEARWKHMAEASGVRLQVSQDLAPGPLSCKATPGALRDALTNLVLNAVDAMPNGGVLTVSTQRSEREGFLDIVVRDTGAGMDEETRRRCLEPFYSTKGKRGTGLGLPMVYGMTTRAGGELLIESELGEGTEIRMRLPELVTSSAADAAVESPNVTAFKEPSGLTLLLVDDDETVLESLGSVLRSRGHKVYAALGGQQGLDYLEHAPTLAGLDALVTDLGMPDIDGYVVSRRAKELCPGLPVVVLTGWGRRMIEENGDNMPNVDRILSKPPSVNALLAALSELLLETRD